MLDTQRIIAFRQLLQQAPQLPDAWYNLAFAQHRAREFEAALDSYRRALDAGVGTPEEVHLNRAVIFADHLARRDDARAELNAALGRNPDYVPAWVNLGTLEEQMGQREPARRAYEKALTIDRHCTLALARLPGLTLDLATDDPLLQRLREAIRRPAATALERADLGFALGKALDEAGLFDEAFAAYDAANQASRAAGGGIRYDAAAHERSIDSLIAAFSGATPVPAMPPGRGRPRLIFICGMFRSGSTLLERIIGSHPAVTAGGEIDLLPTLVRERLGEPPHTYAALDAATLRQWREAYLDGVVALYPGATVLTDKRPDNFLHIGLIRQMFPDAAILHTQRNALDNCLSIYFLHLAQSMPHALDLTDTAHWYGQYRRAMAHWKRLYGEAIHDVDYDALVVDPRRVIEKVLSFCGLPWEDRCLRFHESAEAVNTPSGWQVRQPLYSHASGRWRHYALRLEGLRHALSANGVDPEGAPRPDEPALDLATRERRHGHKAVVLWFTGLSAAGKTTIAQRLEQHLFARGAITLMLDGDKLRHGLNADLRFSEADRDENIRRAAQVARLGFEQGAIVLCSFISPFQRQRDGARSLLPAGRFVEIHVQCEIEVCRRRDPKGLYAKAACGEIRDFTGVSAPYEAPPAPDLVLDTAREPVERSVEQVLRLLVDRGLWDPGSV